MVDEEREVRARVVIFAEESLVRAWRDKVLGSSIRRRARDSAPLDFKQSSENPNQARSFHVRVLILAYRIADRRCSGDRGSIGSSHEDLHSRVWCLWDPRLSSESCPGLVRRHRTWLCSMRLGRRLHVLCLEELANGELEGTGKSGDMGK